ncbi:glutamate ABC transporter permease, partial [Staphylococcus arlettae]
MAQSGKLILVVIIMFSSLLMYVQPTTYAAQDEWEKIKERGELRVGLSADYAPYEFEHNVDGKRKYDGID